MAMKDWKLVKKKKDYYQYGRNYDKINGSGDLWLFVTKQDYDKESWGNKESDWRVDLDNNSSSTTLKSFKTQSQAMAYARSYMKSH
jgi:hypothetical protein